MLCLLRQRAVRTEIWVGVEVAGRGCLLDGRVQGMLLATATVCVIVLFCSISELLEILSQ